MWRLIVLVLVGCGGPAPVCGEAECAGIGAAKGAVALSAFEQELLAPVIADVRGGIQPWNDTSIGVCKGNGRDCDGWIGTAADDLPPGDYMLRAEVSVPDVGPRGTWKLKLDTECTTTRKKASGESTSTTTTHSRDYEEMQYSGEEHGSRISPMYRITSPNPGGAQSCTWKLTALHPEHPTEWTGRWSVPAVE